MFSIDDASASATLPTPEAAGAPGYFTEGNPGGGVPATLVKAAWLNMIQSELTNLVVAAGLTPSKVAYNQVLTAILKISNDYSSVRGLVGANNASNPNTQYDLSAAAVKARDPSTGYIYATTNLATLTVNTATAGPAANGRDQAGVFTASQWLHKYFIYNPTTNTWMAIVSSVAPPTGPTLPTGYTAWAYAGAVYWTSGSILSAVDMRGAWASYRTQVGVLAAGTAVSSTAIALGAAIPPNALEHKGFIASFQATSSGGGGYSFAVEVGPISAVVSMYASLQGQGTATQPYVSGGQSFNLPNIANNMYYKNSVANGSAPSTNISITGYKMPNGGE